MLRLIFDFVVKISNYRIALYLLNLRSKYHTKSNKFYYSKQQSKYYVMNNKKKFYILEKKRLNFYVKGLETRLQNLKDDYLISLIDINNNDNIIDCGANIGEFRFCLPNMVNYFAFEPGIKEYSCLILNINKHDQTYCKGLWNKDGYLDFYINNESADSSYIEPSKYFYKLKTEVTKLDSIKNFKNKKIKLLKLEAEGCEPEVLEGALSLLKNIEFITADLGYERGVNKESTFENVFNVLKLNKFSVIGSNTKRGVYLFRNQEYKKIR